MQEFFTRAKQIKLVIFDVDGVMTDGSLYLTDDGQELKAFNSLDGHGMKMLKRSGVDLAIITGRTSKLVLHRAKNLGIEHIYQGVENKVEAYEHLIDALQLAPENVAYMGDDVVDLPVMRRCGLALCVANGHQLAKQHAHFVTKLAGGHGAVREICELMMQAQGTYDAQMAQYLS
ncbi:3-deoxy-manno-octulosonate-8-phosphatase KdsC [Sulfurirhabdus autotrophica]|uniref:3-deoxy-D-manno-octulosonate 8-phosphate phosphatase KdsC n=1 Tax=Sulfurirhabdus autotrophica TaxID=1706046 RepID=A0A4R3XVJ6_9PROT|nr:3-deoxy-manno-octulosonate-8-phosphatase KdsC [Sulfurirhabdus autotrophica]TCV80083.1 3-deoxy-D-manno-octulosonate 8-phosphate phosphatase (KDO 8-P phosphatase) [Sulfurirhabdus autotrophica]